MSQENYPAEKTPTTKKLQTLHINNRGFSIQDTPFMLMLSILILVFSAILGAYIIKDLSELQTKAEAISAAEKIYNTGDLLSAGSFGSTRSTWVKIPKGYEVGCYGDVVLKHYGVVVGTPLHVKGVYFECPSLQGRTEKYHLKLEYVMDAGKPKIIISEIL